MSVREDPEKHEKQALFETVRDFTGARVLEIGCGDGRLTWQYAHQAAQVTGIDPDSESIAIAVKETPPELLETVTFSATGIEEFNPPRPFDLVILSWSL